MHGLILMVACLQTTCDAPVSAPPRNVEQESMMPPPPLPLPAPAPRPYYLSFRLRERLEPVLDLAIRQTDGWAAYGRIALTCIEIGSEWYLGNGWSSGIALEAGTGMLALPAYFSWYPIEGVGLTLAFDLLRWRPVGSVSFTP